MAFAAVERIAGRFRPVAPIDSFPELACLRGRLAPSMLAQAERRAERVGTGADRVLITAGALSEETYLSVLADSLGTTFEPLDGVPRGLCPLDGEQLVAAAQGGVVPLIEGNGTTLVVAPRALAARSIAQAVHGDPALARRLRFTTAARFNRFVLRCAGDALAAQAAHALARRSPQLSACPPRRWGLTAALALTGAAIAAAIGSDSVTPATVIEILAIGQAMLFMAWLGLRIATAAIPRGTPAEPKRMPDHALPVYSVICALDREAASVGELLAAFERLDYPREKLDVIVALEADDKATRAALEARGTRLPLCVVTVPTGGPRTKPRALNAALPFAHGAFTVIYDAEDRPEPDQLRRALQVFARGGKRLACVQARLTIDNTADGWLARLFTAEYAGQFDVFLPGLAAMRLPLPLGGSSNHFHGIR